MPNYRSTLGKHLVAILLADGWTIRKQAVGRVMLVKDGHQSIHLTTPLVHSVKRVKAICENAKLSAQKFDELYRDIPTHGPSLSDPTDGPVH